MSEEDSEFVAHEPCPECGSSDALARYSDGHAHCFSCNHYEHGEGEGDTSAPRTTKPKDLIPYGEPTEWDSRGITEETAKKWGFTRSELSGQPVRVFNYRTTKGQVAAQKVRFKNKDFRFLGDTKAVGLYGMHLWRDSGKKIVITEGELDAMSVSQAQNHKWPVVSLPNGAQGARKALQRNLEWLEKFEEVILMFDQDEPGQAAVESCASLFRPGKCKVAELPLKDANEMLCDGRVKELIDSIWSAKVFRPDGVVAGNDLFDTINEEDNHASTSLPFQRLNTMTKGMRRGELMTVTAGSGIGKSAVIREIAYDFLAMGETIGMLMLEESVKRTARGLMGIVVDKPLHDDKNLVSEEEFKTAFDETLGTGRVYLYDHFGSTQIDNLMDKIRYLAKGCDCGWIFLDHLSIVVSGMDDGDERRMIDNAMTKLKSLAMECDVGIILVSHLRRPSGDKGHENGADTSLSQLRGSHAIAQLSDFVIGLERDQQDDKEITVKGKECPRKNITSLRVLKNRYTGETGPAGWLLYEPDSGRLREVLDDPYSCPEGDAFDTGDSTDF